MGAKTKGTSAERELVHALWAAGWTACRVAGSGSMHYPAPDIIASKDARQLAIECKTTRNDYQYFERDEIEQLKTFALLAGAAPWIGVRFSREPWVFVTPAELSLTPKKLVLARKHAKARGKTLSQLLQSKYL